MSDLPQDVADAQIARWCASQIEREALKGFKPNYLCNTESCRRITRSLMAEFNEVIEEKDAEIGKLREMLKELEWSCDRGHCPWCGRSDRRGHDVVCELEALLSREAGE